MTQVNTNAAELTAITRMDEIVQEIQASLDSIHTESVKVGLLLQEANTEFKEQGEKSQKFLDWAFENFSIKKAQAYKLMTVAEHFGTDDRFKGVSMRVLYALATQADEEVLDKAAELASNGSLTTTTLNLLLNPAPAPVVKQQLDDNKEAGSESLSNVPNAPASEPQAGESASPDGVSQAPTAPVAPVATGEADAAVLADNAELRKQVSELLAQIKELTDKQTQFNKSASAPLLPQFKHKSPWVVLGISEEDAQSATKIKAAFRDLVKCGYGNGHEAFDKLVAARDSLLNAE
ncbi:hypothetical protein [Pseudomonas phage Nerthus]|uniref:Uncharacterized protein n=1 Tax=Pseudomonas phage Nerthus TaxID=2163984 RepID=A0A2S1GMM8_9CAUD|nr:hypothetical protein HOT09_gp05 [Pseudomonas phage Nerthus]AWD90637.1 hypothetical protein [Pseudomonas phage Nerthus]